MLTEIYIEALLVDEVTAILAWSAVAYSCESKTSEGANGLLLKPSRTHIRKLDK